MMTAAEEGSHHNHDHDTAVPGHVVNDGHAKSAAIDLIAGMCAGTVNVVVGLPMDTIKVKMQTFPVDNPKVGPASHLKDRKQS